MAEIVTCPACAKPLQVPEEFLGKAAPPDLGDVEEDEFARPVDDTGDDERPRPKKRVKQGWGRRGYYDELMRFQQRRMKPHRGTLLLVFGILSILFFGPGVIFGALAWYWGTDDLNEIYSGRMDKSGEGMTKTGRILGMIGVFLHVAGIAAFCCSCVLGIAFAPAR